MGKKEIKDMTIEEMRAEIKEFCGRKQCNNCPLSLNTKYGSVGSDFSHDRIMEIMDNYKLALMLEVIRGNLIWKDQIETTETVTSHVSEVTMSVEGSLLVDDYADATKIVISGKKPTSVTVFYDQEGGGD